MGTRGRVCPHPAVRLSEVLQIRLRLFRESSFHKRKILFALAAAMSGS